MLLEVEGKAPVEPVGEANVRREISKLRSYGPASYASLTDAAGNYVQVAGGGVTCMLERREASTGQHFRAFHDKRSAVFADGTRLAFSGGEVLLASDEWFTSSDVEDVFIAFLRGEALPSRIMWRDITPMLK